MRRKSPQVARDEATEEFHIQAKQRNLTITGRILYCVFSSFLSLHFVTMLMARLASQLCARFIREDKRIERSALPRFEQASGFYTDTNYWMREKQRHALIAVLGENSKDLGNAYSTLPSRGTQAGELYYGFFCGDGIADQEKLFDIGIFFER
jgi:hypothetical protein